MFRSVNFYGGLAIGAGLMYLLDPDKGKARRGRLRESLAHALGATRDALEEARDRARGVAATAAESIHHGDADDEGLAGRVRATLERYVSHPGAVRVEARGGSLTLSGPILRGETEELIGAVSAVRGVSEVLNRLEPHDPDQGVPELRGRGRREGSNGIPVPLRPGLQLVAGVLGAGAMAYGAGRIAARVRAARFEELEREMPEYAMLR